MFFFTLDLYWNCAYIECDSKYCDCQQWSNVELTHQCNLARPGPVLRGTGATESRVSAVESVGKKSTEEDTGQEEDSRL